SNDVIRKAPGSATENHYRARNVKKHIFCLNQYGNKKNLKPIKLLSKFRLFLRRWSGIINIKKAARMF
ncbi:hypothetical protein J9A98_30320, partial [Klebsiella pneumoniae]